MKKIMLISDSHGYSDERLLKYAAVSDEVWHAGDWGTILLSNQLEEQCNVVRGVYGNIDGQDIRKIYPKELFFECEGIKVLIVHIGGYPGRYQKGIKERIMELKPGLFISGHSHICKIVRDNQLKTLHFNPGAIGKSGFHKKRTMITFEIDKGTISAVKVLEYDK